MKTLVVARASGGRPPSLDAFLRARGHDVLAFADNEAALTAIAREAFDLIAVAVPDAAETCRALRARAGPAARILAVLEPGYLDPLAVVASGADDFVDGEDVLSARIAIAEHVFRRNSGAGTREAERRDRELQHLLASERMASMGSLAACIAHEINNPLTYVIGNLSYAARGLADLEIGDDPSRRTRLQMALGDAREGVERIRRIAADLTVLSQPEQDEQKVVDPRRVLEASINLAWNEVRHRARLERDYGEIPPVLADEVRLGQVFLNLLLHTARAIPEGSAIDHAIVVRTSGDGARAMVELSELGARLSHDEVRARAGTGAVDTAGGLALTVSATILVGMGGVLRIDPEGSGARIFQAVLPAAHEAPAPGHTRIAEPPAQVDGRARILVVDDEPVIASTMRRALEGHDIYIVTSGRDALELCRGQAFDLVLCDLMMPDLTGMDLYEELRKDDAGREKRIIFMTGGAFTERARRFLSTVPWVEKPFDVDEIQAVVQKYFRR